MTRDQMVEVKRENRPIRRAAVLGAGVMGAAIAAHMANAGIPCLLLDRVPDERTEKERGRGYTLSDRSVRNRFAEAGLKRCLQTKPPAFFTPSHASYIQIGNLEDDLDQLKHVDWIVEAVIEKLEVKQQIWNRVASVWQKGTWISTNTSGIPIRDIASALPDVMQPYFAGTHFFNPPRYMKLLELVPGPGASAEIMTEMAFFCEERLGKGVIFARDTPNFIANRVGTYGMMMTIKAWLEQDCTLEEVEALTGTLIGRPKSATFRTMDLVGLDTFLHVCGNVMAQQPDEHDRKAFDPPSLLTALAERGWLGEKAGQGFYRKQRTAGTTVIEVLDVESLTYRKQVKPSSALLSEWKQIRPLEKRLQKMVQDDSRYGRMIWATLQPVLLYAVQKLGEITDRMTDMDQAMKWGFNWELGPFEIWDALGVGSVAERMRSEGLVLPDWLEARLRQNPAFSFYPDGIDRKANQPSTEMENAGVQFETARERQILRLSSTPRLTSNSEVIKVIKHNKDASLYEIGDEVACLVFHSPRQSIGAEVLSMIRESVDIVEHQYRGLVIGNEARHFCVGANLMLLLMEAQEEEWDEIEQMIHSFQQTMMKLKYCHRPVVAAPHSMTLGGGVEVCLPADQILLAPETYFGLVETGVGLIPAGGGCKEAVVRLSEGRPKGSDRLPELQRLFQHIAMAKVSSSGAEALESGLLRPTDRIVLNRDRHLYEAKQTVLQLDRQGYVPRTPKPIQVSGRRGCAILELAVYHMQQSHEISDHDAKIASKLAFVMAGGHVPEHTIVAEQHVLDLEREAFLSLCGEPKTQARMQHMLQTGKPLRN
ncbi:3-hydroxyacyl-CoA dehydrogenase/enoyl-CoA hydratase family protein [Marinicrinis sediminis]|uniref:3-hydroxyacyl-CoA dehydrogenase/enoyl-CoA hydratase family protein n=1 Tax=Marinicrinis sediminis TaxID=1652465 RepID=A0ABW5RDU3_9BACL